MRADEIAEAVLKLKSDGKLLILDCLIYYTNWINSSNNNRIIQSVYFLPLFWTDGWWKFWLYANQWHSSDVLESIGSVFREDNSQTRRMKNYLQL
jgi:hypothetical protein